MKTINVPSFISDAIEIQFNKATVSIRKATAALKQRGNLEKKLSSKQIVKTLQLKLAKMKLNLYEVQDLAIEAVANRNVENFKKFYDLFPIVKEAIEDQISTL